MKLLKEMGNAIKDAWNLLWALIGVGFVMSLLFGVITVGCSKSLWMAKTVCNITVMF